jgi:hypothetical protein
MKFQLMSWRGQGEMIESEWGGGYTSKRNNNSQEKSQV